MADQGKVLIRHTIPASTARGLAVDGAGALSATNRAIGLVYEGTDSSETAGQVQISGTGLATAAGAVTAGELLAADAAGKMVAVSAGSEHLGMCIALEAAAADELFRVKIV